MKRMALIAAHEFRELVWRKRFLFTLFSLPLFMLFMVVLTVISVKLTMSTKPVGYVDEAGILDASLPVPLARDEDKIELIPYPDEAAARADLDAGKLQAYYVIAADYPTTRDVRLVYHKRPSSLVQGQFTRFVQVNLLADYPPQVRERIVTSPRVNLQIVGDARAFPNGEPDLGFFVPLILGFAFMMLVLMSANYLMAIVSKEKENRMAEIMLATVRPSELIVGKIIGISGMNLMQVITWTLMGALAWFTLTLSAEVPEAFRSLTLDWPLLLSMLPLAVVSYIAFAAAMAFVGVLMPDVEHGQQVGGFLSLVWALPLWLIVPIVEHPEGPLALALSLVPGASLLTIALRSMGATLPAWQLILALLTNTLCAVFVMWLTVKTFTLGMLRYGQRVRLAEVWSALRARR